LQTTQRKKPHKLLKLEAILRRLRKTSPNYPYFQELHRKLSAGFQGELRVDRLWQEMNFTFPHQIFYDYCFINNSGFTHQIDTLFVTPHFLCLIEIKNILERLDFDYVKRQCIRTTSDGKTDSIIYPVDQLLRHQCYFQILLKQLNIELPIVKVIVIANQSTVIGQLSKECPIMHSVGLPYFLRQQQQYFDQHSLATSDFRRLLNHLTIIRQDKLWEQKLTKDEWRSGVLCPMCTYEKRMFYRHGSWFCRSCGVENNEAFLQSLQDYRLLRDSYITTNTLCQEFNIPSKYIAYRIVKALKFEKTGNNRYSHYKKFRSTRKLHDENGLHRMA